MATNSQHIGAHLLAVGRGVGRAANGAAPLCRSRSRGSVGCWSLS